MNEKKIKEEKRDDDIIRKIKKGVLEGLASGANKSYGTAVAWLIVGIFTGVSSAVVFYIGLPDNVKANSAQLQVNTATITEIKISNEKLNDLIIKQTETSENIQSQLDKIDTTLNIIITKL